MWIITKNTLGFIGTIESIDYRKDAIDQLVVEFQLIDGDGETYFWGWCDDIALDAADMLYDYREAFGCTTGKVRYRTIGGGAWRIF